MSTSIRSSVLALTLLAATPARAQEARPPASSDALDPLRERFREGMEKYHSGAFAEAIVIWESIYRELGAEKGYRLAFNLGRAYDQFGDTTRATEHYEAYVKEALTRKEAGETVEPLVDKQVTEARERLAELAATKGRLRIVAASAIVLRIDGGAERLAPRGFVAYVAPGKHIVTFEPNARNERSIEVNVDSGSVLDVSPPEVAVAPPPAPITYELRPERPFSKSVLWVAAGATVLSAAIPLVFFAKATSTKSDYYAPTSGRPPSVRSDYEEQRTISYATWSIPAVLGAATIALTAYWLGGGKTKRVPVIGQF